MKHISNSQIGTILRCPRQYEFSYIKGIKIPPKAPLIAGSAYHGALGANFKHKLEKEEDLILKDILDAYDTSWNKELKERDDIDWEDNKPNEIKDEGYRLVSLYHKVMAPNIIPIAVEKRSEKLIDANTTFVGYIDLERENDIIDHKLMRRSMNQNDANKDTQPLSYALLVGKKDFVYHVAVKKKTPEIQLVHVKHTKKEVDWFVEMVRQILAQIKTGVFPPNTTSWLCNDRFCGYYDLCHKMTGKSIFT